MQNVLPYISPEDPEATHRYKIESYLSPALHLRACSFPSAFQKLYQMSDVYNLLHEQSFHPLPPLKKRLRSDKRKAKQNQSQTNRIHWYVQISVPLPDSSHRTKSLYRVCSESHRLCPISGQMQYLSHTQSVPDDTENGRSTTSFPQQLYLYCRSIHNFRHKFLVSA